VDIPSNLSTGNYYLIAKADADNAIVEAQESNNAMARLVSVGGDLTLSSLIVPTKAAVGGTIVVTDTTTNVGAGAVAQSTTRFYLSRDTLLDASDTVLAARTVPALAGGVGSTESTTLSLPTTLGVGTYYVIAKVDADNVVAETQEANNTAGRQVIVGPDLIVASFSGPFTIAAGSTVVVTDVAFNSGGDVAGPSTTRFYLSANQFLDAGDVLLAGSRAVPALAGSASSSGSTSVTFPAGTAPGIYYLFAVADADGVVTEAQETNNTAVRLILVVAGS